MSIVGVDCSVLENSPHCAHGPTIKFSRLVKGQVQEFYACSACRDRKDCPFFLLVGERITESKKLAWKDWELKNIPQIDFETVRRRFEGFNKLPPAQKRFCLTCFDFVFPVDVPKHVSHRVINEDLKCPLRIIEPLENNKKEAQFWFSENSKRFLMSILQNCEVESVVCLGTPTLHELLIGNKKKSLLLDLDHRYHYLYSKDQFRWFNMFNFHLMNDKEGYDIIHKHNTGTTCLIIDPPFGARIEPIANSIRKMEALSANCSSFIVLLVLPYFMEPQVLRSLPDFEMLDYQIQYTNHRKFNEKKKKSTPVRVFLRAPDLSRVKMPPHEGYYFCAACSRWRSQKNKHCHKCNTCPSKNGEPYKHCNECRKCVKVSWSHCSTCGFCALSSHMCAISNGAPLAKKIKRK